MFKLLLLVAVLTQIVLLNGCSQEPDPVAELERELERCQALPRGSVRDECYANIDRQQKQDIKELLDSTDEILGKETPDFGHWEVAEKKNPIDDTPVVVLTLMSYKGATSGGAPSLVIRCKSNTTNVFIAWLDRMSYRDTMPVTTRLDSEKAQTLDWSLSTNNEATFFPGKDYVFAKKMIDHSELIARTTPRGENPVTAYFDLDGLPEAIKPLREACNW